MTTIKNSKLLSIIEPVPEQTIDSKLELIKYLAQVQSRIKTEITSDYTYAIWGEKDKKLTIEMTSNAYYGRKLYTIIAKTYTKWDWNQTKQQWEQRKLNEKEQDIMQQYGQNQFDSFMIRPTMLAILNRNVKNNYLMKYSAGTINETEDDKEEEEKEQVNILKKMGSLLKRNDTEKKEVQKI